MEGKGERDGGRGWEGRGGNERGWGRKERERERGEERKKERGRGERVEERREYKTGIESTEAVEAEEEGKETEGRITGIMKK